MMLIGLAGHAGAGKDTVAIALNKHGFIPFSFSDALYQQVAEGFAREAGDVEHIKYKLYDRDHKDTPQDWLALEHCNDEEFVEAVKDYLLPEEDNQSWFMKQPRTPRQILQLWGTEYRRKQDPDYWIKRAQEWLDDRIYADRLAYARALAEAPKGVDVEFAFPNGYVNTGVRFQNEVDWIRTSGGVVWHVWREATTISADDAKHASEVPVPISTGDKLFLNYGPLETVGAGVMLALQGNDIVNTKAE